MSITSFTTIHKLTAITIIINITTIFFIFLLYNKDSKGAAVNLTGLPN